MADLMDDGVANRDLSGNRCPQHSVGTGHRAVGILLQSGNLWDSHGSALEALYQSRPPATASGEYKYFHPTFLYESLWDLAVFVLLFSVLRKRREPYPVALFLSYLALYSFGRFFIEGLRIDSLMLGPFRAAQVMSLFLILCSVGGLWWLLTHPRRGST